MLGLLADRLLHRHMGRDRMFGFVPVACFYWGPYLWVNFCLSSTRGCNIRRRKSLILVMMSGPGCEARCAPSTGPTPSLRLLRLGAPPHRVDARLPPPLLEPPAATTPQATNRAAYLKPLGWRQLPPPAMVDVHVESHAEHVSTSRDGRHPLPQMPSRPEGAIASSLLVGVRRLSHVFLMASSQRPQCGLKLGAERDSRVLRGLPDPRRSGCAAPSTRRAIRSES